MLSKIKYKKPKNISLNNIKKFFYSKNLKILIEESHKQTKKENIFSNIPYKPDLYDLFRLYKLISLNKRTTIVEFGTGWSTLVMIAALNLISLKKMILILILLIILKLTLQS